ncbi:EpsG family protein [Priestia megaterium]
MFLFLSSIPLILIMGLRDKYIGTDAIQFYSVFTEINTGNYGWLDYGDTRYEVGYFLLNKIIGLFTQDPQVFLLIISVIIVAGICIFIYQNSRNPFMSLILFQTLYFYCNSFNLVRQYIAIAIVVNSLTFIKERKIIKSSLIIIIASTFHTSALFLLPLVILLCITKINKLNIYMYFVGFAIFSFLIPIMIQVSVKLFPRYDYYLTYNTGYSGGKILPYLYIIMVIIGISLIRKLKISDLELKNYYMFSIFVFITGLLGIIANLYFQSASRIMAYSSIYLIVFIPEFVNFFTRKVDRLIITYGVITLTIIYYNLLLHSGVAEVYPYAFFKN